ncbi:unnamed protein product, partial [Effrenium voratum]
MPAQPYDITRDQTENLMHTLGFAKAVGLTLRVMATGLFFAAVPCNSYTFLSSGTHGRSEGRPFGRECYGFVHDGTVLAARVALLAALSIARQVQWFCENPLRTTVTYHPYIAHLLQMAPTQPTVVSWHMGNFGGWSAKPQVGFGNAGWMPWLQRPMRKGLRLLLKQRREFQGGKEMVKTTIKKNRAGEEVRQV